MLCWWLSKWQQYPWMTKRSFTASWSAAACTNVVDSWSLLSRLGEHCPMTSAYACFLFSSSWTICFFTTAPSCCRIYISPGLTMVSTVFAFGYPDTCRVGRLNVLILPLRCLPHLYTPSVCGWLWHRPFSSTWIRISCFQCRRCRFRVLTPS